MLKAYSRTEHLARSILLGRFDWSRRMAMYSAYFDESGHPDRGKYLIVAGGLASVDQWVHLEREWAEVLAPFGTTVLHTVDFERRKPPFDQVTDKQAIAISQHFASIICRRLEKLFSFTLHLDDYRVINRKYVFAECYGYPYPMAARSCIGGIEGWAKHHSVPISDILFFFEDGAKHKGQLEWIAERDLVPIPVFRKKSEVISLQVGDFIAWHQYQIANDDDPAGYSEAVMRCLNRMSNSWKTTNLDDPDRLPFVLDIPLRLPEFCYKAKIVRDHGVRRSVVHYRRRDEPGKEKLDKKTMDLGPRRAVTPEEVDRALAEYDAKKRASQENPNPNC
ncbi:MAG: DUF3800 domain-containing protein [Bryobacteraceae bacterium]|jgi:hypothetical protein